MDEYLKTILGRMVYGPQYGMSEEEIARVFPGGLPITGTAPAFGGPGGVKSIPAAIKSLKSIARRAPDLIKLIQSGGNITVGSPQWAQLTRNLTANQQRMIARNPDAVINFIRSPAGTQAISGAAQGTQAATRATTGAATGVTGLGQRARAIRSAQSARAPQVTQVPGVLDEAGLYMQAARAPQAAQVPGVLDEATVYAQSQGLPAVTAQATGAPIVGLRQRTAAIRSSLPQAASAPVTQAAQATQQAAQVAKNGRIRSFIGRHPKKLGAGILGTFFGLPALGLLTPKAPQNESLDDMIESLDPDSLQQVLDSISAPAPASSSSGYRR